MGEQEGEEPIQACRGPPGDDVEEDGSVEDLEDGGRVGGRSLCGRRLLPEGETPALGTGASASAFPTCATNLRVLRHWGQGGDTSRLGSPVGPGHPPHPQQPSAPSALPVSTQVLPRFERPAVSPEGSVTLRHRG